MLEAITALHCTVWTRACKITKAEFCETMIDSFTRCTNGFNNKKGREERERGYVIFGRQYSQAKAPELQCSSFPISPGSLGSKMSMESSCNFCSKSFADGNNLSNHMLTHERKKDFKCEQCNNLFIAKGSLKIHMLIHCGKEHNCSQCNKAFTQVGNLRSHQLIHTEEKPYKCTQCNYSARQAHTARRLSVWQKV